LGWFDDKNDKESANKSGSGHNAPDRSGRYAKAAVVKAIRIDRLGQISPLPSHRPRHRRFADPSSAR
jgi:hypothetical protein